MPKNIEHILNYGEYCPNQQMRLEKIPHYCNYHWKIYNKLTTIVRKYISLRLEITAGEYIGNPQNVKLLQNSFTEIFSTDLQLVRNKCAQSVCYYCNIISQPPVLGNRTLMSDQLYSITRISSISAADVCAEFL